MDSITCIWTARVWAKGFASTQIILHAVHIIYILVFGAKLGTLGIVLGSLLDVLNIGAGCILLTAIFMNDVSKLTMWTISAVVFCTVHTILVIESTWNVNVAYMIVWIIFLVSFYGLATWFVTKLKKEILNSNMTSPTAPMSTKHSSMGV